MMLGIYIEPPMRRTDEYGENCLYRDTKITVFTWLRGNSEHETDFKNDKLTRTTLILDLDILWLLLAPPLTYFVSLPLKKMLDAAKNGSREHVLILLLITATLVPCLIVNLLIGLVFKSQFSEMSPPSLSLQGISGFSPRTPLIESFI